MTRLNDAQTSMAKGIRAEYGRGWLSWKAAKQELLKQGFDGPTAGKILLGTLHLLGD